MFSTVVTQIKNYLEIHLIVYKICFVKKSNKCFNRDFIIHIYIHTVNSCRQDETREHSRIHIISNSIKSNAP